MEQRQWRHQFSELGQVSVLLPPACECAWKLAPLIPHQHHFSSPGHTLGCSLALALLALHACIIFFD